MLSPPRPPTTQWLPPVSPDWKQPPRPHWQGNGPPWADEDDGNAWLLKIALGAVLAAIVVPFLVVLILYTDYKGLLSSDLPAEKPSVESGLTRIYDDAGDQIALLREFDLSIPVSPADIPDTLKAATVATEDRRFYEHTGVDDRAILRALWRDFTGGGYVEGASTITQQYVRLLYVGTEKTIDRKIKEASLARRVEKELTKDAILSGYLDRVYLGGGAYGVGAAAQSYFRKSVKDLTLSESALLAGLIQLPSVNDPRTNPAGAEEVRGRVLGQMLAQGKITQAAYNEAAAEKLFLIDEAYEPTGLATVIYPHLQQQAQYPYFVDYVRRYLVAKYGDEKVYRGGLKVYTSINPAMQAKAEASVAQTLQGTSAPLEMAMVSVDPRTGLVRAMVGGRDFTRSEVNLALGKCYLPPQPKPDEPFCIDGGGTGRQPGSAFKPFTLARALEEGISVSAVYSGPSTYRFPGCTGSQGCTVSNVESSGYGALSLRQATAYSVNTVYAQLIGDVGVKDTAAAANRFGLTMVGADGNQPSNGQPYGPSLTLGAAEVSVLDMASAYGTFANRGLLMAPSPVIKVEERNGTVLEDIKSRKAKRVLAEGIADEMNDVLKGVVTGGTGTGADIGRPEGTAGKTGTSEDYGDAWFVGYTPELSTAIWMGYSDSRRPLTGIKGSARVYGGTFAAPTWKAYMTDVGPLLNLTDFARPGPPPTVAPGPGFGSNGPDGSASTTTPPNSSPATTRRTGPTVTNAPISTAPPRRPQPQPTYSFPVPTTLVFPTVPTTRPPTTSPTTAPP
ncbi:MAG: transglycosylase domain-containing protein [Acidimicrobiales bacterium]